MISPQTIKPYLSPNSTVIVGFSGGPDSVCLLTLVSQLRSELNLNIIAAHLDHQWRPESAQDAIWCAEFCKNLGVACIIKTPADLNISIKNQGSKEELGRKLRRHFFQELAAQYQADHILLAHHQDDQLETFFIRMIRGSSLTGLVGMQEKDGLYLRPLLSVSKQEILNFLTQQNISFLTDATNLDPKFLRNRIRHQLMPQLTAIDARFANNLKSCMTHLQKTDNFLDALVQQTLHNISDKKNQNLIDITSFLQLHEIMQHRILLQLFMQQKIAVTASNALFQEIMRFLKSNKHQQHQLLVNCTIIKLKQHFYFKSL